MVELRGPLSQRRISQNKLAHQNLVMTAPSHNSYADYVELLGLLMLMVQAQSGQPIDTGQAWQTDRQTLAKKLAYHLRTVQTIHDGSTLQIGEASSPFVDHGSITVLARAVVENFIVFAHVYGNPDMDVSRFKHMAWRLGGLMDRQKRLAFTGAGLATQAAERPLVDELLAAVKDHQIYKAYPKGKQKALVKVDWSAGLQWHELAVDVGFNERYFRTIYSYLCDYSHSSYAAAMQTGEAKTRGTQAEMSSSMLGIMNFCMARFIAIYAELFESAKEIVNGSAARAVASKWNFRPEQFAEIYAARPQPMAGK